MRGLLLLVLAALPGFAVAQWTSQNGAVMQQISSRSVGVTVGSLQLSRLIADGVVVPRTPTAGPVLGEVVVADRVKGPSPRPGDIIDIDVKRKLPWASISRAVAKSLPLVSTAVAIAEIAEAIRCREAPGGLAECDAGQAEETISVWCVNASSVNAGGEVLCAESPQLAVDALADYLNAINFQDGGGLKSVFLGPLSCPIPGGNFADCWLRRAQCFGTNCTLPAPTNMQQVRANKTDTLACPEVTVNGTTLRPVKGPDGKCVTNLYEPASVDAVADKVEDYGDKSKAPLIVDELLKGAKPIDHAAPDIDPVPDSVVGPRETTSHPDGSTTIKDTVWDLAPTPTGYEWTPRVVTKEYPPGATIPPPGDVTDGTTTTGAPPREDPITCGLPNTPPCKIDESGTPSSATIDRDAVNTSKGDALEQITDIGAIQAPAWSWSFSLPTSCSALNVGPFAGRTVVVDLCEYQPMIHDIVSLLWAAFTVWACIGMVGRTFSTG
jgi:hypothetical protein